jgi:hypothetical protein
MMPFKCTKRRFQVVFHKLGDRGEWYIEGEYEEEGMGEVYSGVL